MANPRKQIKISVLKELLLKFEKEAEKRGWGIDDLFEEAVIYFLYAERLMGKTPVQKKR